MQEKTPLNQSVIDELEQSKNEVLQRIAEKLKNQMNSECVAAKNHSSHSSGTGRTHNSTTSH